MAANWILIFWIYSGFGHAPATAIFKDKPACEAALNTLKATVGIVNFRNGMCVADRSQP